jgi:hypothetical protein
MTSAWMLPLMAAGCIDRALQPNNPCGAPDVSRSVQIRNVDKVDVLFVIDDSSSMADEQEKLRKQVPEMVRTLLTGSRGPDDPKPFAPVRDLHVAVVRSDMGATELAGCSEYGADGVFQHAAACGANSLPFLSYLARPDASADALASDFACMANVGTSGCSREQPLEAALKALWLSSNTSIQFMGEPSHGDRENAGFLRSDPEDGLSLVAVVVLSDEEDASPFPVSRYIEGFRGLRPGLERLALFSAVVSVPPELVDAAARSDVDFSSGSQRDAYYDRILSDPRMQRPSDTASETSVGSAGRRYIELAKALGQPAAVTSIQDEDYSSALSGISDIVDLHLDAICLPEALSRDRDGKIACNMIWELPPERINFDTPIDCGDRPAFLSSLPGRSHSGGKRCLVEQHPASGQAPISGEGWYYDDFSTAVAETCAPGEAQRAVFTPAAVPPTGVTITVECWTQEQRATCESARPRS